MNNKKWTIGKATLRQAIVSAAAIVTLVMGILGYATSAYAQTGMWGGGWNGSGSHHGDFDRDFDHGFRNFDRDFDHGFRNFDFHHRFFRDRDCDQDNWGGWYGNMDYDCWY